MLPYEDEDRKKETRAKEAFEVKRIGQPTGTRVPSEVKQTPSEVKQPLEEGTTMKNIFYQL